MDGLTSSPSPPQDSNHVLTPSEIVLIQGRSFEYRKSIVPLVMALIIIGAVTASSELGTIRDAWASRTWPTNPTFFIGLIFVFVGSAVMVPQLPLLFQRWGKRGCATEASLSADGKSRVLSQQLVSRMLKVALLAHERAGSVRFETQEERVLGVKRSSSLLIVPTGKKIDWPSGTLEARLLLDRRVSLSDVVFEWLAEDSANPWDRAVEQGNIMLVLRSFVAVSRTSWGTRKYVLAEENLSALSQTTVQSAEELLTDCLRNQPEIWQLLDREIKQAVTRRTHQSQGRQDQFKEVDPWLAEGTADQDRLAAHAKPDRLAAHAKPAVLPIWMTALVGIALSFFVCWLAIVMKLTAFAAVTAAVFTIAFLWELFRPSRDMQKRIQAWVRSRGPVFKGVPDPPTLRPVDRIAGLLVGVPILTAIVVSWRAYFSENSQAGFLIACVVGFGFCYAFYLWYKRKAAAAINAKVMGAGSPSGQRSVAEIDRLPPNLERVGAQLGEMAAPTGRVAGLADSALGIERSGLHRAMPIALEVLTPDALPPASQESRSRLEAISLRAPSMRSAYSKGIAFLAISTTLLGAIYWLTGPSPFAFSQAPGEEGIILPDRMPVVLLIFLAFTLLLLSHRGSSHVRETVIPKVLSDAIGAAAVIRKILRFLLDDRVELSRAAISALISGRATVKPVETDETKSSIRPAGLILLGGIWLMVALFMTPFRYASLPAPQGFLFSVASLAFALSYLYWIHRTTVALERRYPYQAPLSLLALRVFGSPNLPDFLDLTSAWQWIGTRQMLDGPDTVGDKMRDLTNYFTGRIEDSVVEDLPELHEAIGDFRTKPDRQLRFPVNSMQCSDATWKEALQHLLLTTDVVVMDLSNLSKKNRGVAHELGKLVDNVPLQRVVLLVNDSTEMDVLTDILARAWENMAADSPNRDTAEPRLRLYHIGGASERAPEESLYDWKRRQRERLDEKHLVCLLYDAAKPPRIPATIQPNRDKQAIRWGRVPMRPMLRTARNIIFLVTLFFILLISSCRIIAEPKNDSPGDSRVLR